MVVYVKYNKHSTSLSGETEALINRTRKTYGVGTVKYHSNFPKIAFSMASICSPV